MPSCEQRANKTRGSMLSEWIESVQKAQRTWTTHRAQPAVPADRCAREIMAILTVLPALAAAERQTVGPLSHCSPRFGSSIVVRDDTPAPYTYTDGGHP